jgi:hypothetical protein
MGEGGLRGGLMMSYMTIREQISERPLMLETKLDLHIARRFCAFQFAKGISPNGTRSFFPVPECIFRLHVM